MKLNKEVKTGILAIVAIALLVFGYNFLKGNNLFNNDRIFYVVYEDIEGLDMSSSVMVNGLKVGRVQDISIDNPTGNLVVQFIIDDDFTFSKNSIAKIYGGGIIGGKSLAIIPDYESSEMAKSGDTLTGEVEEGIMELVNERLSPLQQKLESSFENADSLLVAVNQILDQKSRDDLKETIANLNDITTSFKSASQNLDELLVNNETKLNRTFDNLDVTTQNLSTFSDSLSQVQVNKLIDDLDATVSNFNAIAEKINQGEGSVGKLLQDEQLYDNLEGATRQLEELLQDVKLNPKRYVHFSVFGKRPGGYEEPDDSDK